MLRWLTVLFFRLKLLNAMAGIPERVSWTPRDKANFQVFLRSQTGQRLLHLFRTQAMGASTAAINMPEKYPVAVARGWQEAFGLLCKISGYDPLQVVDTGQVSLTETNSDTSEQQEKKEEALEPAQYGFLGEPLG